MKQRSTENLREMKSGKEKWVEGVKQKEKQSDTLGWRKTATEVGRERERSKQTQKTEGSLKRTR